jgi:hypothetical protein
MMRRGLVSGLIVVVGAAALVVGGAASASASCASASPPGSPYAFSGTVVATELTRRVAVVVTDAGETVEVRGTNATSDNQWSSVDREYVRGMHYEFHPLDGTSPYHDNLCTATHETPWPKGATKPSLGEVNAADPVTVDAAVTSSTGSPTRVPLVVVALGLVVGAVGGILWGRERRRAAAVAAADPASPARDDDGL